MSRVALITGASRGLGFTLADFLGKLGYTLVIDARDTEALAAAAGNLRSQGAAVVAIPGSLTETTHRCALAQAARRLGRLDLLINNASDLGPSPLPNLVDYPLDRLYKVFDTNVIAPVALVQEVLPLLRAAQGSIINITSDAALGGYETWGGYGSSKAALDLVSKTLANELKGQGVAVVSVDPGDMRTQMHQEAFPGEDISDRPTPQVTLPFWAWLLGQDPKEISGQRLQAQADRWTLPNAEVMV